MKKVFFLVLMSVVLSSCSKEDGKEKDSSGENYLNGTKWQTTYSSTRLQMIEFTSEKEVMSYKTDNAGNIITTTELGSRGAIEYGEYSLKNDSIIFIGDVRLVGSSVEGLKSAKVSGNIMHVTLLIPDILNTGNNTKEKIFIKK